jgi:phage terminase large subunit-like protein
VERSKRRRPKAKRKRARVDRGWWGEGQAPWKRWGAGVTIVIEAKWCAERKRWESDGGRYYFDEAAATRAVDFFPTFLKHHKGEFDGQPFSLLDYQRVLVILPLFGWKRASDNLRRFRKVFLFIPKGNGKSPLAAGTAVILTLCDDEPGAEVYIAAGDREQARIIGNTVRVMVERDEVLSSMARCFKNVVEVKETASYLHTLSAEAYTKHGFNPHGIVIDELHVQPNRDLLETLERGMPKRRQPIEMLVSTAGDDDESICYEEYEYAKGVISGSIADETYLPIVFELPEKADWRDMRQIAKCNPGLGITIKREGLEAELTAALAEPRKQNAYKQLHGNRWTSQLVAWIPVEQWDECPVMDSDLVAMLPTLDVAAGLDLAQKWDLCAFVLVFRIPLAKAVTADIVVTDTMTGERLTQSTTLNYRVALLPHFWIPEETALEHEQRDRIPYRLYAERGWVTFTEGVVIDNDQIFRDITTKIAPKYPRLKLGRLGYDPAFATDLAVKLKGAGFNVAEVPQNYQHLSEPSQILEALLKAKRVVRDDNRLMRWNVENVMVRQDDAGRIRPVKPKKGKSSKRVDGVVATVMGVGGIMAPEAPVSTKTVYETRQPYVLTEDEIAEAQAGGGAPRMSDREAAQEEAARRWREALDQEGATE